MIDDIRYRIEYYVQLEREGVAHGSVDGGRAIGQTTILTNSDGESLRGDESEVSSSGEENSRELHDCEIVFVRLDWLV